MADDENSQHESAQPRRVTPADLQPGTAAWRVNVAMCAHQFFGLIHDPEIAAAIDKPEPPPTPNPGSGPPIRSFEPWSVHDFSRYLHTLGVQAAGQPMTLHRILSAMERAGLLLPVGWDARLPMMGQQYISQGAISPGQRGGNLWLSEVCGGELIIPSYNAVTIRVTGHDDNGDPVASSGSGLILDHSHVVTNRHVIAGLVGNAGLSMYPAHSTTDADRMSCQATVHGHPDLDVAVLEGHFPEGKGLPKLFGMAFRDPEWADEVYVFGYPRVPWTAEMSITVHRGEVVNPATTTIPDRHKVFLYSATARPGNSGGPIVAQDGRVIGLVVEDAADATSSDGQGATAPFYRGIPSSEVIRALDDLGYGGIAEMDTRPY